MSTTMQVTPAANAKFADQPAFLAGGQTATNVFTVYQQDDLFSTGIPAVLGSNLVAAPVTLANDFLGIHLTISDIPSVRCGIARTHDTAPKWNQQNPSSGVFIDAGMGAWLRASKAAGATTIVTIFGTPTWASARPAEGGDPYGVPGGIAEPANMTNLATYVTWLVSTYYSWIDVLEVWNEPKYQVGNASFFSGTASKLAEVAKTIYQAAKAVKPTITIVGVGCTGVLYNSTGSGIQYTDQFLAASDGVSGTGKNWIDVISVHTYAHDGFNDISQMINTKGYLDTIKTSNGIANMDVWATEWGYITPAMQNYTGPAAGKIAMHVRYALWNVVCGMKRAIMYRYGADGLGWGADTESLQLWNQWAQRLNGATVSLINRVGNSPQLAAIINGARYII